MALEDVKAVARDKHTNHTGDMHVLLKLSRVICSVGWGELETLQTELQA